MKFNALLIVAVLVLSLLGASVVPAQNAVAWKGAGGWGPRTSYTRMYDPKTVETVKGEVVSVDRFTPAKGTSYGVHAMVKTDKETISVHLGPGWYVENQEPRLASGDKIEVKGSRVTFEGKPALIAAEVRKGDDVLVLRDTSGFPAWSGWKRR
ncbi:MAG: DNA-binding protein [Lysobacterales bacterium]|jgi:hypothetical protein|nr:MAG: DNA-binding protein [Xanthomonadales bacterium]